MVRRASRTGSGGPGRARSPDQPNPLARTRTLGACAEGCACARSAGWRRRGRFSHRSAAGTPRSALAARAPRPLRRQTRARPGPGTDPRALLPWARRRSVRFVRGSGSRSSTPVRLDGRAAVASSLRNNLNDRLIPIAERPCRISNSMLIKKYFDMVPPSRRVDSVIRPPAAEH